MSRVVLLGVTLEEAEEFRAAAGGELDGTFLVSLLSLDRVRGMNIACAYATPRALAHPKIEQARAALRVATLGDRRGGATRIV